MIASSSFGSSGVTRFFWGVLFGAVGVLVDEPVGGRPLVNAVLLGGLAWVLLRGARDGALGGLSPATLLLVFGLSMGGGGSWPSVVEAVVLSVLGVLVGLGVRELKRRRILPGEEPPSWPLVRCHGLHGNASMTLIHVFELAELQVGKCLRVEGVSGFWRVDDVAWHAHGAGQEAPGSVATVFVFPRALGPEDMEDVSAKEASAERVTS